MLLLPILVAAAAGGEEAITATALLEEVKVLAAPEMAGRGAGTAGGEKAAKYIARQFEKAGLKPGGGQGSFQPFKVITGLRLGQDNSVTVEGDAPSPISLKPGPDFTPFGFSEDGSVRAEVVFAGYGITAPELHYDDYAGLDVTDKIVLVMAHEPREKDEKSPFRDPNAYRYTEVRYKAINAREHGAKAIVIVEDPLNHQGEPEELFGLRGVAGGDRTGIVAINAKRSVAERMLRATGRSLLQLQQEIDRTLTPRSFQIPKVRMAIRTELIEERGVTSNVVGLLPGRDPILKETAVVIGAHYDHLGLGGEYSLAPSHYGEIHPGADDNASGTAGVIELARAFAKTGGAKRTLVFVAFAAEEMGLLGSSHYVKHPTVPLDKTVAMLNLDMIGRLRNDTLYIFGVKTGQEFEGLLQTVNRDLGLKLELGGDGYGPSDHTSFSLQKRPVLFFFTGPHADYHRPSDTVDKINAEGLAKVVRLVYRVAGELANRPEPITFVQVDTPPSPGTGRGYGAYFGSIPDFAPHEREGVRLSGVRPGSPAERAGLREGDVIVKFGGTRIKNLHDLVYVLRSKRAGDQVEVVFLRNGQELKGTATLEKRQ